MVALKDVLDNNESLKVAGSGVTAVFVGATNGIGLGALRAFTKHTASPTAYVVGRSFSKLEALFSELKKTNESATFIPIIANDLTLIKDSETAAEEIAKQAKKLDLLIMSPGYISISRDESPEGLDRVTTIRYYARMRFLVTLAPLLRAAPSPRVVSVLASGKEGQLWPEDWTMKDHYSLGNAGGAGSSMTTLFLEEFAQQPGNEKMTFVHIYPGLVGDTGLTVQGLGPWVMFLLNWVVVPIMKLVGYTSEEAGERVIFAATSGRFRRIEQGRSAEGSMVQKGSDGKVGSGVYLVQGDSSVVTESAVLKQLKSDGMAKKVYDHTLEEFDKIAKL